MCSSLRYLRGEWAHDKLTYEIKKQQCYCPIKVKHTYEDHYGICTFCGGTHAEKICRDKANK